MCVQGVGRSLVPKVNVGQAPATHPEVTAAGDAAPAEPLQPLALIHRQGEVVDGGAVAHVDAAVDVDEILEGDPKGAVVIRSVIQLKFIHMMVSYMQACTHVYIHYACMHACINTSVHTSVHASLHA